MCFTANLVVEEQTRQMKMKIHRYNQTTGSGSSQELEHEQYTKVNSIKMPPLFFER